MLLPEKFQARAIRHGWQDRNQILWMDCTPCSELCLLSLQYASQLFMLQKTIKESSKNNQNSHLRGKMIFIFKCARRVGGSH